MDDWVKGLYELRKGLSNDVQASVIQQELDEVYFPFLHLSGLHQTSECVLRDPQFSKIQLFCMIRGLLLA